MGVHQGPLGHAPHDAPELGALHQALGVREGRARVDGHVGPGGELVVQRGRPDGSLLFVLDSRGDVYPQAGNGQTRSQGRSGNG